MPNKLYNADEMDKYLGKHELSKLKKKFKKNQNRHMYNK